MPHDYFWCMTSPRPVRYVLRLRLLGAWRFFPQQGIHPLAGFVWAIAVLGALVALLFVRTASAPWLVAALPAALALSVRASLPVLLLRLQLDAKQRLRCRLAEAAFLALPFLGVLLLKACWLPAVMLVVLSTAGAVPERGARLQLPVLRSPFPAPAVEWHAAWRRFGVLFVVYGLSFVPAVAVHNGAFAGCGFVLALFGVCGAYGEPEAPELLVLYRGSPARFLRQKALLALKGYVGLLAPLLLCTLFFFRELLPFLPVLAVAGALLIAGALGLKYLCYPNAFAIQFSQGLFFGLTLATIAFPPLFVLSLLLCGYAWFRARRVLALYLPC